MTLFEFLKTVLAERGRTIPQFARADTAATHYLTMYPGDEVGLRRLLGHISTDVMQTYVHMSQSVVAERAGRASLSTSFLQDAR